MSDLILLQRQVSYFGDEGGVAGLIKRVGDEELNRDVLSALVRTRPVPTILGLAKGHRRRIQGSPSQCLVPESEEAYDGASGIRAFLVYRSGGTCVVSQNFVRVIRMTTRSASDAKVTILMMFYYINISSFGVN
ncbi:hypothetical protein GQ44DRAFT_725964 [Phaeosphaeriaceae sp. PMI808]|nr:hypothetical protein GQ44DRAFT_725964 [Phaeosphaeriaceae sp. PMI808]